MFFEKNNVDLEVVSAQLLKIHLFCHNHEKNPPKLCPPSSGSSWVIFTPIGQRAFPSWYVILNMYIAPRVSCRGRPPQKIMCPFGNVEIRLVFMMSRTRKEDLSKSLSCLTLKPPGDLAISELRKKLSYVYFGNLLEDFQPKSYTYISGRLG